MYDVIVVGARCAGAAAALRFARSGYRVLLLDKRRRGSDCLSTHVLNPVALAQLRDLGLLAKVEATGAPPVPTFLPEFGGQSYPLPVDGDPAHFLSVRRTTLDPILVDAAAAAGATVRFEVRVDSLIWDGGRVAGVRGVAGSRPFAARGRLVVGADGRRSVVARTVAAAAYNVVESPSAAFYAYLGAVGPNLTGGPALQFAEGPGCDVLCCPCDGDLHVVLLIVPPEAYATISRGGADEYLRRLHNVPTLAPRLHDAQLRSRLFRAPVAELRGYFRHPAGPGWALIGDAGYYAHPAAANGIADALRSAELLHAHALQALTEGLPAETYLDRFRETRDAENIPPFYASYRLGHVNPFQDPELAAAIRGE